MRRLSALVVVFVLLPATAAWAGEIDDLLQQGQDATYSAEQVISCATPDGSRDAVVKVTKSGNELRIAPIVGSDVEVEVGSGVWALSRKGERVAEASVDASTAKSEPLYTVEQAGPLDYLGRPATAYRLVRDQQTRALLVLDDGIGAVVKATTYTEGDDVYCERRLISLQTDVPEFAATTQSGQGSVLEPVTSSDLPAEVAGFDLLDHYLDDDGVSFAYYSDGFFSFAVFQTPSVVALPDPTTVDFDFGRYGRMFTPGQVMYSWETDEGGMALVGDLPPDLHATVLEAMPHPDNPGFLRKWWRALFG